MPREQNRSRYGTGGGDGKAGPESGKEQRAERKKDTAVRTDKPKGHPERATKGHPFDPRTAPTLGEKRKPLATRKTPKKSGGDPGPSP